MSSALSQFGMARVGTAMGNYWPQSERIFARNVDRARGEIKLPDGSLALSSFGQQAKLGGKC